jgi:RHS repeat-associated protein
VATGSSTSRFYYDGAGNRVRAVRNGVTTRYLHDAGGNVVAELDGTGTITRYYIHGLGLLALVEASGPNAGLYVYHADGTGHMVALSDAAGAITHRYSYASFGEVLAEEEAFRQPFTFAGQVGVMRETAHELYYMRARYYHSPSQRFINEDPSGFNGGLNLYVYVGGNPLRYVDPNGLTPEEAAQWAQSQVGSLGYSWAAPNSAVQGSFLGNITGGIGAPKCNIFVFDALAKGDVGVPLVNGHVPTTADWVNGAVSGYRPVTVSEGLKLGDVVVGGGHMGIYAPMTSGEPATVSAASPSSWHSMFNEPFPAVRQNDFGFRSGDSPRVFRAK